MGKILFVASEAMPFAATGGLGDVIGSLPAALKALKGDQCDIRVVLPLYSAIKDEYRKAMQKEVEFEVQLSWRRQYCGVYSLKKDGVVYYFIDNEYYFKRESMYGNYDDGERYAYFCHAVIDMLPKISFYPDILHANDWQSALCVVYLKCLYSHLPEYSHIKTVYTIHNIEYQGKYDFSILDDVFGIPNEFRSVVEYNGCCNLSKGAIVCCDKLTTVSPRYAEEIQSPDFSSGLHYIVEMNRYKLCGILNGIDTKYYNPEKDKEIYYPYSVNAVTPKRENKKALQREIGLPESESMPLISMITRLVSHKGIDLVSRVIEEALTDGIQFVILGTGESKYETFFEDLEKRYPHQVKALIQYNKSLSKKIYAASDIFLMPSKSEPCGLAQMIASAYGTIPIVRETGGLYDSIKDFGYEQGNRSGNGFTFADYNAHDMLYTIRRACDQYKNRAQWVRLVKKVMKVDFSWNASAALYQSMYETL